MKFWFSRLSDHSSLQRVTMTSRSSSLQWHLHCDFSQCGLLCFSQSQGNACEGWSVYLFFWRDSGVFVLTWNLPISSSSLGFQGPTRKVGWAWAFPFVLVHFLNGSCYFIFSIWEVVKEAPLCSLSPFSSLPSPPHYMCVHVDACTLMELTIVSNLDNKGRGRMQIPAVK